MPDDMPANEPAPPTGAVSPSAQVLAETQYLRLVQQGHWTYAQRTSVRDAVAVIAVTREGDLLLVDQYRIPVGGRVIELPAGLVGDTPGQEGEPILEAAQRELLEETGYEAEHWEIVTQGVSSAGLTDESIHLVWAERLQRRHAGGGVGHEDIRVCAVPLRQTLPWLAEQQRQGKAVDFKVYAGILFAAQRWAPRCDLFAE